MRVLPLAAALPALAEAPVHDGGPQQRTSDSVRGWALAAKLAIELVSDQLILPDLAADRDGAARARWRAAHAGHSTAEDAFSRLALALPPSAYALARSDQAIWSAEDLLQAFLDAVADLAVRASAAPPRAGRPRARLLPWTARWAEALGDRVDPRVPLPGDAGEVVAGIAAWHASVDGDTAASAARARLRLGSPDEQDGLWRLELAVETADGDLLGAESVWRGELDGAPGLQEILLRGLARAVRVFPPLESALRQPAPTAVDLTLEQAWQLLHEAAPLLAATGMAVLGPDELDVSALRLRLRVGDEPASADGDAVSFAWEAAVGDETVTPEELETITRAGAPLVRWRDRWVRVDPQTLGRLGLVEQRGELGLVEGLALALTGVLDASGSDDDDSGDVAELTESEEVVAVGRVAALLDGVRAARDRPPVAPAPAGFDGQLRPYQRRGVAWLHAMGALGLGGVLADDMGLGKTVQLIAYLLTRAEQIGPAGPWLVVCPTSVLGNWQREIARFAPKLAVRRHHGPERAASLRDAAGVVLTSYGTLRRDAEILAEVEWDVATLDEAQQVKNPGTVGAGAVRRLRSRQTIAMTGTPLENRLAELWSLMDATNPGLLGSRTRFGRRFVAPIERRRDRDAAVRLRQLVAPFLLRRTKTDPEVAPDLPEKIERSVICAPTSEQARLYREAVDRALSADGALAGASRMQRRGRILALLTQLKQVCNHPAQYLHETEDTAVLAGRSGKLAALCEIIEEAADAGERVVVFTQYVAMGRLLVRQLRSILGADAPFLHGGTPAAARDAMVARFQDEPDASPVLIVSLRAGGTGLNLTAASQVVHYDRWWNPAVEDQATDRAHRIGQLRTVEVHRLITAGTLEERIAELLERKRALADSVVGVGETWITELSDADLAALVALSDEIDVTDLDDLDDLDAQPGEWSLR